MKVYVSIETKKEDMKSTAYAFLSVGILGLLLLALLWAGILTVQLADYMKVMLTVVMGAMFLVFVVVGIQSLRQYQTLKTQSEKEQDLENEVKKWFSDHFDTCEWDNFASDGANLYYERYEKMESMIRSAYPNLEETFLDHLIEELYADFFEENLN